MENTDWSALGFDYRKTDYNVRYSFADGKWSDMVVTDDEYIQMHMSASCLHYGIELFEGLKAFRGVDGKVRLFRVADNARRLQSSAKRLCLPVPSIEMIVDACIEVVKRNERFVPPYGTGASLSASGDVRNDGRIGRETGQGSPADRLLFARRSLF